MIVLLKVIRLSAWTELLSKKVQTFLIFQSFKFSIFDLWHFLLPNDLSSCTPIVPMTLNSFIRHKRDLKSQLTWEEKKNTIFMGVTWIIVQNPTAKPMPDQRHIFWQLPFMHTVWSSITTKPPTSRANFKIFGKHFHQVFYKLLALNIC